jgi:xylan 1,4-beta-xylosidase
MVYLCGRMIGDGYSMLGRETALVDVGLTKGTYLQGFGTNL